MGGRLTRLKEFRLKKSSHAEVSDDEEEVKEWDEKDKVKYERNKQFKKLIVETMAMSENMEKMQLAFCKTQGMDDYLYNMGGMSSKAPIPLPPKFKIFDEEKFDGTRDPKQHVGKDGKVYPGWEMFFNEKITFKEKPTVVIKEIQEKVDWVNYMDAEAMKTIMKTSGDKFAITNEKPNSYCEAH
ncbi:hypothetical protein SO802_028971 [Lithocarpus litseifolius]|uniref:Uncharacterized protein n=1 Tax=Lithocarpus litseifolius TaxID=425828 RepID=A0AAW2BTZ8_9ROSI